MYILENQIVDSIVQNAVDKVLKYNWYKKTSSKTDAVFYCGDANSESGLKYIDFGGVYKFNLIEEGDDKLRNLNMCPKFTIIIDPKYIWDIHDNNDVNDLS